jgi:hypothetical protein
MSASSSIAAAATAIVNDIAEGGHVTRRLWRKLQATFGHEQTTLRKTKPTHICITNHLSLLVVSVPSKSRWRRSGESRDFDSTKRC